MDLSNKDVETGSTSGKAIGFSFKQEQLDQGCFFVSIVLPLSFKCFHIHQILSCHFRKILCGFMDSYSGSVPRKYISFRLGKSTPKPSDQQGTSDNIDSISSTEQLLQLLATSPVSTSPDDDINTFCAEYVASKKDPLPKEHTGGQPGSGEVTTAKSGPSSLIESHLSETSSLLSPLDFSLTANSLREETEQTAKLPFSEQIPSGDSAGVVGSANPELLFDENFIFETVEEILAQHVPPVIDLPTDPRLRGKTVPLEPPRPTDPRGTKRGFEDLDHADLLSTGQSNSGTVRPILSSESPLIEIRRDDHTYADVPMETSTSEAVHDTSGSNTTEEAAQSSDATLEKEATSSLILGRERAAAESLNPLVDDSNGSGDDSEDNDQCAAFSQPRNTLSAHSSTLIKRYFDENPTVHFPSGHQSVSFSEKQVGCLVRAVSEETSFVSFRMMNDLLEKAAGLKPVFERKVKPSDSFRIKRPSGSRGPTGTTSSLEGSSSDGYSSGGASTDDGMGSVVYHRQKGTTSDCDLIAATIVTPQPPVPPKVVEEQPSGDSIPSSQELKSLGAIKRQLQSEKDRVPVRKSVKERNTRRQRVPDNEKPYKPNKILSNASFEGFDWAKVFATGPQDPDNHKYSFFCRFCHKNVSMYGKGRGELIRHYQRKSHFRIDQRWRYEHLRKVNPITGVPRHYVRGWDGRLLDHTELQKELPYFEDSPLVEIGPCYPFYSDHVKGLQTSDNSSATKASVQLSVFSSYLPGDGNLSFLARFWSDVGSITNHQSSFASFDWSQNNILVSHIPSFLL